MKTLRALSQRRGNGSLGYLWILSVSHFSIIIPNMSPVKIRREINKSNFYGTIWSQASVEAVKLFIANLCLRLTLSSFENI